MNTLFWVIACLFLAGQTIWLVALRLRNAALADAVRTLLYLCEEEADFRNGITDGPYDEGAVRARYTVDGIKYSTGLVNMREHAESSAAKKGASRGR